MYTTLIDVAELHQFGGSEEPIILDCRFSLADPTAGKSAYQQGHLPGAQYAHLDHDLSSPIIEGKTGRHPLPSREDFIERLQQWGVNDDSQIIVYDDAGGAIAARAWWLCQWAGHAQCAVLNGGIKAWTTAGYPITTAINELKKGTATLRPPLATTVNADEIQKAQGLQLIDARAAERYSGQVEPLDKVAGHIPGALNIPFGDNLDVSGKFLPPTDLAHRFQSVLDKNNLDNTVHYCGSGVTAAHNILAMHHAGLGMTQLYPGSWSEWIQSPDRPVAKSESV